MIGRRAMPDAPDLEAMAATLEASSAYRVLRRLTPRAPRPRPEGVATRRGVFLDLETTGLDPARDEIIEFAMVPFTYGLDGEVYEIGEAFSRLRQPSRPIPPEITTLTGIDDAMVQGAKIDPAEVAAFAAPAALIVAHNAGFDRRFAERFSEVFTTKAWACSMNDVAWAEEGFEGTKLAYLANAHGLFFDGHRAIHDCLAGIEVLARPLRVSGRTALTALLESARRPVWRIWAENSPFDLKDQLKARGYRWNGEANGRPRAWWTDVADHAKADELAFLQTEIYQREVELLTREVTAYDRYSDRC